ncbi:MAG: alcohol dehydrogenase catalytic domain-containing protein [Candidatus Sumerlaeota bacterium]
MKVVQLTSPEKVEIRDVPARREAEPGEVLLEPILVGLTGTDAMRYRKGAPTKDGFRSPHVPGAEFVARVVRVGRGVDPAMMGKRVVANPLSACLKCTWCFEGNHHLCPNMRVLGTPPVPGALQQRFSWPANLCIPVPEKIRDEEAVLLIPLSMAIHIADQTHLPLMASVAVIGCGSLGLLLIEALRKAGAGEILAVDLVAYRRDAGYRHGATLAYDPIAAMEVVSRWPRQGVDIAIDVSNASEGSRAAVQMVRTGGRVVIAGIPEDNRILFNARDARHKELTIQFVRRPHDTLARAVQLLQSGSLKRVGELITHRFPLTKIAEAYKLMRRMDEEVIKIVIEMDEKAGDE